MRLRNLFILLWAINSGGLLRIFALTGIVAFLVLVILLFLSLLGGPAEIIRSLQKP
jgi:hypothetical protein